jgi:hypothetical protein
MCEERPGQGFQFLAQSDLFQPVFGQSGLAPAGAEKVADYRANGIAVAAMGDGDGQRFAEGGFGVFGGKRIGNRQSVGNLRQDRDGEEWVGVTEVGWNAVDGRGRDFIAGVQPGAEGADTFFTGDREMAVQSLTLSTALMPVLPLIMEWTIIAIQAVAR